MDPLDVAATIGTTFDHFYPGFLSRVTRLDLWGGEGSLLGIKGFAMAVHLPGRRVVQTHNNGHE
jgi:hypothetical protein